MRFAGASFLIRAILLPRIRSVASIAFLIASFFAARCFAESKSCSTIKNVAPHLGPAYDQEDLSWCYAFSMADLMTAKMQKEGSLKKNERIHPIGLAARGALTDLQDPTQSTLKGKNLYEFIAPLISTKPPLCKETDLDPKTSIKNRAFQDIGRRSMRSFVDALRSPAKGTCETETAPFKEIRAMEDQIHATSRELWRKTLDQKCHTPFPEIKIEHTPNEARAESFREGEDPILDDEWDQEAIEKIDKKLTHGVPVSISYDVHILMKDPGASKKPSVHESVVIARKQAPDGTCLYQIRNSWGPDCSVYKPRLKCDKGTIWVPQKTLIMNSVEFTTIE